MCAKMDADDGDGEEEGEAEGNEIRRIWDQRVYALPARHGGEVNSKGKHREAKISYPR